MGDAAKGRVDEEICRRDLPTTAGRKPDYAKRFVAATPEKSCMFQELGRANLSSIALAEEEACEGGLGALSWYALWLCFPMRRV
jgi:hypothetical protein